jgi:Zn-dependent protease
MNNQNQETKKKGGTILGGLGLVGYLLLKFKVAILAVLKFGWLAKGFLSIFITVGIYAVIFGWQWAVAVVLALLVHEGGHWIWMKALGLKPRAPMFIPFIGAFTAMTELPPDETTQAWVAIAGPLVGGVFSAAMYYLGGQMNSGWLMAAGSFGFLLNLTQLIPAKPLDGGFIAQTISPWLLLPGSVLLCGIALTFHWIFFGIIGVFSLVRVVKQLFGRNPVPTGLIKASLPQKFAVGFAYLALTGMLGYLWVLSQTTVMDVVRRDHHASQLPAQLQSGMKTDRESEQEPDNSASESSRDDSGR